MITDQSTIILLDGLVEDAKALINAAAEAGDYANAIAIFEEFGEWISLDSNQIAWVPIVELD